MLVLACKFTLSIIVFMVFPLRMGVGLHKYVHQRLRKKMSVRWDKVLVSFDMR